mgnify:CR=1 FL=1
MNVQFAVKNNEVYLIEVTRVRAYRSVRLQSHRRTAGKSGGACDGWQIAG